MCDFAKSSLENRESISGCGGSADACIMSVTHIDGCSISGDKPAD